MKKREKNETKEWMFQGCYKGYSVVRTRRKGAQILTFGSVPSPSVGEMKEPRSEEPSGDKKKKKSGLSDHPLVKEGSSARPPFNLSRPSWKSGRKRLNRQLIIIERLIDPSYFDSTIRFPVSLIRSFIQT